MGGLYIQSKMIELITRDYAHLLLEDALKLNPGKWGKHSYNVAMAAEQIAKKMGDLDSDKAYIFGLLHDIGRRYGVSHIKHVYDGMLYMEDLGYRDVARICLTHSFPVKNIYSYSGAFDLSTDKLVFLESKLASIEYDDYDRLIQLCDAIASADGFCILEVRLIDVAIRNGINEYSIEKWKRFIDLKNYFDEKCNLNIYNLLGII